MKIMKALLLGALVMILAIVQPAAAAPKGSGKGEVRALKSAIKKLNRSEKQFGKKWRRASLKTRKQVIQQLLNSGSEDGDNDGLPDDIDNSNVEGTEQCLADSDGDGLDDGTEFEDGLDPSDDDTDDDGTPDSRDNEEAKGTATYSAPLLTIKGSKDGQESVFTLVFDPDPQPTQFENVSPESLDGACVEVEGFRDGDSLIAVRVKSEDDCGGDDDDGGERDD
jgi:hypothetical protein